MKAIVCALAVVALFTSGCVYHERRWGGTYDDYGRHSGHYYSTPHHYHYYRQYDRDYNDDHWRWGRHHP